MKILPRDNLSLHDYIKRHLVMRNGLINLYLIRM